MKIGLDIDGVILNSEVEYRVSAEIYDIEVLGEDRNIHPEVMAVEGRYNWTEEEAEKWHQEYLPIAAEKASFMPGAIEIINKLQEMGHEIYVITARGGFCPRMKDIALKQFEEAGLNFESCHFIVKDKGALCKELGIDIMIDDNYDNCIKTSNAGIKTLYYKDLDRRELKADNVIEVHNWGEIYKYFVSNK